MKPTHNTLSVVLATYNEAGNLKHCLESVKPIASEIIIVDGQSTDDTVKVAKKLGAKVYSTTNKPNFHINKQMAIDKAKDDWILQLDADEVIPKVLADEITATIASNPAQNAFWINRKNYFLGKFLTKGGQYPDPVIRLFRRGKAHLPAQHVHEQMAVNGQLGTLKQPMLHYTAPTFSRYLTNSNRYTSLTALDLANKHLPINLITAFNYMITKPLSTFFSIYLRHKGFLDGFPGFVFAFFSGLHHSIAYMKYWEQSKS